jgi:hypothetical protein
VTDGTIDWAVLAGPGLCVLATSLIYAVVVRWLFRRRLDARLGWFAFLATAVFIGLVTGGFLASSLGQSLAPVAAAELQKATSFTTVFKLALFYAALPEEATKIGIVVILLLSLSRWRHSRSDPAEMLIYAALGFATSESLLYVAAAAELPQFREHLIGFAILRGIFGGLLHGLLAMVAGFFLAWQWQSAQRWLWLFCAYALAVLLHAAFDSSLLHLVLESIRGASDNLAEAAGTLLIPFLAIAALLLLLGLTALFASRRLGRKVASPAAVS